MIPLRIGFDMDGTLADLSTAYAQIEERLFGPELAEHDRPAPEAREDEQHDDGKQRGRCDNSRQSDGAPATRRARRGRVIGIASGARSRTRRTSGRP